MGLFSKKRLREIQKTEEAAKSHTILIVDDEESNRKTLHSLLKDKYELLEACDGQEALEMIRNMPNPEDIGLIISDQRMPRLTGTELFERLVPILPRTVRIILTGYADKKAILDAIKKAQVYKMVSKPFERKEFLSTVSRALELYELQESPDPSAMN